MTISQADLKSWWAGLDTNERNLMCRNQQEPKYHVEEALNVLARLPGWAALAGTWGEINLDWSTHPPPEVRNFVKVECGT